MLGSRTKQVKCYGKRAQRRVVNSAEKTSVFSPFLDMEITPKMSPVKSRMKNRENMGTAASKPRRVSSPKVIIPVRKRSPVAKLATKQPVVPKGKQIRGIASLFKPSTPTRAPLAVYHPNTPNSPAIPPNPRRRHVSPKVTALAKSFSPFIEMDISIVDGEGHTLAKESRRIQQLDDSDDEVVPVRTRKPHRLKSRVIVDSEESSSSDSEDGLWNPPTHVPGRLTASSLAHDFERLDLTVDTPTLSPGPASSSHTLKPAQKRPTNGHVEHSNIDRPSTPFRSRNKPHPAPPSSRLFHPLRNALSDTDDHEDTIARPRQLTPVRPGRRLFAPPSPASTCSSGDLEEFDKQWDDEDEDDESRDEERAPEFPEYLRPLLRECDQEATGMYEFSAFISTFPYDPILSSSSKPSSSNLRFRKVGEASYSEVFGIGDVVLKIIPIRDESPSTLTGKRMATAMAKEAEGPAPSDARDILKEIIVTRAMGDVHKRYVKLLKTYVVKGRYPQGLLELWDEYYSRKGSESIRPDAFSLSQVYAILVLPNGGPDLESYIFKAPTKTGWRQASSVFWQVAKALAHAEQLVSFEHRDLHLGQILVNDLVMPATLPLQSHPQNQKSAKSKALTMDDVAHGVRVTLIDLGLARMDAGDGCGGEMIHWTPFEDEIFEGEGDYQFDIYRMMRDQNAGRWEAFKPITNVMWLHYLLVKLLKAKGLRAPRKNAAATSSGFAERESYDALVDLEQWLGQCVVAAAAKVNKPVKGKGRRKTTVIPVPDETLSPLCAGEVVEYGVKKRWIRPVSS